MAHTVSVNGGQLDISSAPPSGEGQPHNPRIPPTTELGGDLPAIPIEQSSMPSAKELKFAATFLGVVALSSLVVKRYAGRDAAAAVFVSFGLGPLDIALSAEAIKNKEYGKIALTTGVSAVGTALTGLVADVDMSTVFSALVPATAVKVGLHVANELKLID